MASELKAWIVRQLPPAHPTGTVAATFIVDSAGRLWLADRRSEHVACADRGPVLAAGEMLFELEREEIAVVEVTNQSTGFCPEPGCWPVVAGALDRLGVSRPEEWTHAFDFRRCTACRNLNVIKDGIFECDVCGASVPENWNCGTPS